MRSFFTEYDFYQSVIYITFKVLRISYLE